MTIRTHVKHFHAGNSTLKQRQGSLYMTKATIYDGDRIVGEGVARCNSTDIPDRAFGRALAVQRAAGVRV